MIIIFIMGPSVTPPPHTHTHLPEYISIGGMVTQARRQVGFHVARKPPSIHIGGGAQTNFLRDELLRVSHRQIRRVDGTDTRINL